MSGTFKDLFSVNAEDYARFRPGYPPQLFKYFASLTDNHGLAWDVGTGNGQAAIELARYYKRVIATDPSIRQLEQAMANKNVNYMVGPAEKSPLADHSADLITVAQAFHWFQQDAFFKEVKRVSKPNALLAVWCYEIAKISPEIDAKVTELYETVLGNYWEPERKLVQEGYRNEIFPFEEIKAPKFELEVSWSIEQLIGYICTWSALQKFIKQEGHNPLNTFYPDLQKIWGDEKTKKITWNLALRVQRV